MTNLDWNKILNVPPEDLSEQDKEELFYNVAYYDINGTINLDNLKILFKVSQEILKFKGEQVESLVSEIENLAARQGEEEARRHQSLINEIEVLQSQLSTTKQYDSLSGGSTEELKQELLKAELKNEQLISELQARERDLMNEKQEVEKFASQVMLLERERGELRSELAALQRETVELQEARLQTESPKTSSAKYKSLVETVRHKNKHITQLLSDIETLEKENNLLKLKVAGLQKEVAEISEQNMFLSEENNNSKHILKELQERSVAFEEQNEALKTQLMEMAGDKQKRDEQLDQLGIALDARLTQWQELLVQKDTELIELKQKLAQITAQFPNSYMDTTRNHLANITQSLENREEQIEDLQKQLAQVNKKLSESQEIIKELRAQLKLRSYKQDESPRRKRLKSELEEARNRLEVLEARVKDAEADAEAKAEEMTEMVIQLREYETGVFGLPEATEQIKELQKQKKVRDKHIEQLIQAGNQLQADANLLEEENLALREQLGLDADAVIRVDGVLARYKADQLKLSQVTQQLEATNNNLLTLKVQNRKYKKIISKLKAQVKNVGFEPEVVTGSSEEDSSQHPPPQVVVQGISEETKAMLIKEAEILENKLQDVIDENEALRNGMHEILDSVRSHDGKSSVHIESACLERLLEALDSRHLSGWYHPAMRLQAQLNVVEGNNAALREQLRAARYNEHEASAQLHKALVQVDFLQGELQKLITASQSVDKEGGKKEEDSKTPVSVKASEFIEALKSTKEKPELKSEKEDTDTLKLKEDFDKLSVKLKETEAIMVEQKELYESDKESWQNVRKGLQEEVNVLTDKVASLSAEVKEYSASWQVLKESPDAVKSSLANATIRLADLSSENEKLKRKGSVFQELQTQMKTEKDCLQEELILLKSSSKHSIEDLKREKDKLEADLNVLQSSHSECFPIIEFKEMKTQLNELTVKYRALLSSKTSLDETNNKLINQLKSQVELLQQNGTTTNSKISDSKSVARVGKQNETVQQEVKSHAEKMYSLVKDQLKESEEHCKELEGQVAGLVQQNLALQLVEAELRDQLIDSVPHSRVVEVKEQLAQAEKLVAELKAEQSRLQEKVSFSEDKARALEELRHCHDYQHDALQRQVLELTASSEDKVTIGRLTRELLRAQESELVAAKQVVELKNNIEKLQNVCSEQELNMKSLHDHYFTEKNEMQSKYRWLARTVGDLHQRYLGHLSLLTADSLQSMLAQARFEKINALVAATSATGVDKMVEMLKNQYNEADSSTASKLQELKLKVQVQSLESQLTQTEGQLQRIEKLSAVLQDELMNQEKNWEKKQIIWEQKLLENLAITTRNGEEETKEINDEPSEKSVVSRVPPGTADMPQLPHKAATKEEKETMTSPKLRDISEPDLATESESIKILNNQLNQVTMLMNEQAKKLNQCETEISELKSKMESLKRQLDEKERRLKNKERELLDLQTSVTDREKEKIEEESTEVLALKATVASLQNIVNQKEETIGRYQTLLQECRDEHSITVANLQQELTSLQQALDKKHNSPNKESKTREGESSAMKVILERYLARVRRLEDDLAQSRDQAARLAVDLAASQQQTDRWTHTAEERLKTIQEMKQRLDSARSKEDLTDSNSELMEKSAEIESLNKIICNLKAKFEARETVSASRDRLRGELDRANKRVELIESQNTELKSEVQRLRKQLTLRQSSTPKSEVVSTAREESLQKKIKQLEEQIADYQVIVQKGKEIHKSKCDQEFGKWEEKKKWQASNEKLKTLLKEKCCQVEALRANIDRLKDTIIRLEKEKVTLEGKLKNVKDDEQSFSPGTNEKVEVSAPLAGTYEDLNVAVPSPVTFEQLKVAEEAEALLFYDFDNFQEEKEHEDESLPLKESSPSCEDECKNLQHGTAYHGNDLEPTVVEIQLGNQSQSKSKPDILQINNLEHTTNLRSPLAVGVTESQNSKRKWDKKDSCLYCERLITNFTRHLARNHSTEIEVAKILAIPKGNKKRKIMFEALRKRGNFFYNKKCISEQSGNLIVVQRPSKKESVNKYLPCKLCLGWFSQDSLYRHMKNCKLKRSDDSSKHARSSGALLLIVTPDGFDHLKQTIFPIMRPDNVSRAAQEDYLICEFGARMLQHHKSHHMKSVISQKMRELGRLKLEMTANIPRQPGIVRNQLEDFLNPDLYKQVVQCVWSLSGYDETSGKFKIPSLAKKLGFSLKTCSELLECKGLMTSNDELRKRGENFSILLEKMWKFDVALNASHTINQSKWNRPKVLPLAEDLKRLHDHLILKEKTLYEKLRQEFTEFDWRELAEVELVRVILLNRRRSGESQRIEVNQYLTINNQPLHSDTKELLTETEKTLCNSFHRFVVTGKGSSKTGRPVPVLVTNTMKKSIDLLIATREQANVKQENTYLFPIPRTTHSCIRGSDVLRKYASLCQAKAPEHLRSTLSRKHVATMSQLLNLSGNDIESLATFMGHSVSIHKEYYRLPDDVNQMAKISKLLLALESGKIKELKGHDFDTINVQELEIEDEEELPTLSNESTANETPSTETTTTETSYQDITTNNQFSPSIDDLEEVTTTISNSVTKFHNKKRRATSVKKPWTEAEEQAILKHFKKNIMRKQAVGKEECMKCIEAEPCLSERSWTHIKYKVKNMYSKT